MTSKARAESCPGRIVVTGAGAISALGPTLDASMESLYAGSIQEPGKGRVETTLKDPPEVFVVPWELDRHTANSPRTARLALCAARQALVEAFGREPSPTDIGVCLGTTVGCTFNDEPFYRALKGGERPDPEPVRRYESTDLASLVAREIGTAGPRLTVATACASGTDAIGIASRWLVAGRCNAVLAGGADALDRYPYLGFYRLMNSSTERCRPFDKNRKGLNLGEGAAAVVLEREENAIARGARPLGTMAGYGSASDAHHPTAPHPEGRGLRRALALALKNACTAPSDVGFVNAHGTGTIDNDRVEGRLVAELFGEDALVLSTKGYTGHTTGAAGALEAVFTLRSLADGQVPSSAGFEAPDPECRVVPVTKLQRIDTSAAVSTSLAFGGTNSALVLRRWDP